MRMGRGLRTMRLGLLLVAGYLLLVAIIELQASLRTEGYTSGHAAGVGLVMLVGAMVWLLGIVRRVHRAYIAAIGLALLVVGVPLLVATDPVSPVGDWWPGSRDGYWGGFFNGAAFALCFGAAACGFAVYAAGGRKR
jgi:hypothetical protein